MTWRPGFVTVAPRPPYGHAAGSAPKVAGTTLGSSAQRVSATPRPFASVALTVTRTGLAYLPLDRGATGSRPMALSSTGSSGGGSGCGLGDAGGPSEAGGGACCDAELAGGGRRGTA